ncbi:MAG: PaaI family thioesterase [Pseudomonadota bacterium]
MKVSTLEELQDMIDITPFHRWLKLQAEALNKETGQLTLSAPIRENAEQYVGSGKAHGGVIAAIIDTTAAYACFISLDRVVSTINLRVDYLRPALGERLEATSRVQRLGRSIGVIDVEVRSGDKLVAIGRTDFSVV